MHANEGLPDADEIAALYDQAYTRLYGRTCIGVEREIINVRVTARREVLGIEALDFETATDDAAAASTARDAYTPAGFASFGVHQRADMRAGKSVPAPCIIEETESTTVMPYPGRAEMDSEGNLHLYLEEDAS